MDAQTIPFAGFAAGLVLGFVGLRTNFCVMGAVTDIALMRDWRRFRAWLLAIAVALAATETLILAGLAHVDASAPAAPSFGWLAAAAGGLAFGFGMVLAGGCGQRNLVRAGAGSVKALVVVLVMAGFAHMAIFGALAPVRLWLMAAANPLPALEIASQDLSMLLTPPGEPATGARATLSLGLALLLAWLCFKDKAFRTSARDVAAGAVVGLLVAFGWAMTAGADAPESLNFAVPLGDAAALALGEGGRAGFALMAVPGVVLGA
ncbi:MAG: YeeE/YedE family protein, partial [Alphaproteobacteria bacterium]|nr:YeeE/YedE family protein [Alphaproteobacteria bacterium]